MLMARWAAEYEGGGKPKRRVLGGGGTGRDRDRGAEKRGEERKSTRLIRPWMSARKVTETQEKDEKDEMDQEKRVDSVKSNLQQKGTRCQADAEPFASAEAWPTLGRRTEGREGETDSQDRAWWARSQDAGGRHGGSAGIERRIAASVVAERAS
ncbi:hypothetical protein BJX76DRAFT_268529 [Aspergillus varians]